MEVEVAVIKVGGGVWRVDERGGGGRGQDWTCWALEIEAWRSVDEGKVECWVDDRWSGGDGFGGGVIGEEEGQGARGMRGGFVGVVMVVKMSC